MIESIFLTIGVFLILYAFYVWTTKNYRYFEEKGVRHLKPVFLLGNTFGLFARQYTTPDFMNKIYKSFPGEKYKYFFTDLRVQTISVPVPPVPLFHFNITFNKLQLI